MSDGEKFLIEIILEARNKASEALRSVGVDLDNLQKNLKGAGNSVDSFDRHLTQLDAHVTKTRDTVRSLNPTIDALDRKFKSLAATTVAVDKGLDKAARGLEKLAPALAAAEKFADSLEEKLGKLDARLTEVGSRNVTAKVDVDTEKAEAQVDALALTLLRLERQRIKVRVGIEQEILDREIEETEAKLNAIGHDDIVQRVRIEVGDEQKAILDDKARTATENFARQQERQREERKKTADNLIAEVNRELDAEHDAHVKLAIDLESERHAREQASRDRATAFAEGLRKESEANADALRKAEIQARKFDAKFNENRTRSQFSDINLQAQQLKGQDVGFRAVLDAKEFNAEYENLRRRILEASGLSIDVHAGINKVEFEKDYAEILAQAARLGLKKETIRVVIDYDRSRLDRISKSLGDFGDKAADLSSKFGDNFQITLRGVVNGALRLIVLFSEPLLSAITGVVGGLIAVGAAAGSAIGGLIGLAAAAGAQAVPALGTLAVALSRVQAVAQTVALAYKEQQKSGQQQIGLDQARASAADAITSAQEGLVKAQRAVIDAQKQLTDARREGIRTLTDLTLAEENAVLTAQKSKLALASSIGTGSGSIIEAELQARSDSVSANRARVDNRRAQAGGIESLPAVESARTQLRDAVEGVTAARRQLAAADRQAAAASERLIASSNAFEQAFGQLSRGEKKLYQVFHNSDNTGLLDLFQNNLESPIRKTTDIVLGGVARMADGIRKTILDPAVGEAFKRLGKSIASAFDNLRTVKLGPFKGLREALILFTDEAARNFKPLSKIVGELLSIFVSVAKAASGPLRDALDGVDKFLGRIADKASSKSGQNSLANFFDQGLKSLSAFLRLGGAFLNLFLAIAGPGGGADEGVKGIDRLTESINNAAGYIEKNGEKVRKFFHDSIDVTSEVLKIFVGIGKALVEAFDPKSVAAFSQFITDFVLPALVKIIKAIGLVVRGFLALANSPVGSEIGKWVVLMGAFGIATAELIGFVFGLAKHFSRLAEVIINVAKSERLAAAAKWAWNGAVAAFNAAKQIAQLVIMEGKQLAVAAATRVAAIAQGIWNAVTSAAAYGQLIARLIAVRGAQLATAAATRLMAGAQVLLNLAMSANPIVLAVAAIVALGVAFYVAYKKIKPFHEAVDAVFRFIKKHWVTIVEIMLGPMGLIIAGLRKFGPGLLRAFRNAVGDVFDFIKKLPGRIGSILSDGIHNIGHIFESIGSRIVKAIVKGIKSAPKALWNALKDILPGPLKGAIGVIGKGLDAIGLATGARIGGNPADGDSVYVRVKPGEVILNEDQQRDVGPGRINRALAGAPTVFASGRGYATGGGRAKGAGNEVDANADYTSALIALLRLTRVDTDKIADEFTQMRSRIRKTLKNLNGDADDAWSDFSNTTKRMLKRISKQFVGTFKGIADTVYDAFKYINSAANESLDSLGGKPVKLSLSKAKIGDNSDQQMARGGVAGFIGNAGERGRDTVRTILGRGEAVLNWAHQRYVEPALNQVYGFGLQGLFQRVNAEHAGGGTGMARGGTAGGANYFGHPSNVNPSVDKLLSFLEKRYPELVVTSTRDHSYLTTSGNVSDHTVGAAVDVAAAPAEMNRISSYIKSSGLYRKLKQGIHNPNLSVNRGQIVPTSFWGPAVWAQHANHIHLAITGAVGDLVGGAVANVGDKINKLRVKGPLGELRSIVARSVNKVRKAASDKLGSINDVRGDSTQIRISGAGGGRRVGATTFGGPGDPGTGSTGYRGDNLHQYPNSYAELSNPGTLDFAALGGLPYKQRLRITAPTGKSAIAYKRDVGKGGGPVGGVKRGIDLWYELAEKLGLGGVWSGVVKIAKAARGGFAKLGWGGAQGNGGDYIVDKPTMFLAGEAGRERATFMPMAGGGFLSPAKVNIDPTDPTPIHRTNTGATMPSAPAVQTPTQADTTSAADSAKKTSKKAAKAVKDSFEKLYDAAIEAIAKTIESARTGDTKVIARSIRVLYKSFDKLNKKSTKALDVLSRAIDALLGDDGPITAFENAAAARAARIDLGTQKSRVAVTGRGRDTRAEATFGAATYEQRVLGDLGQKRDDLRTEDDLLKTVGKKASSGLAKAQNERRASIDREIAKTREKLAKAKEKGDKEEIKDLDEELKQLKEDRKTGDNKYTKRFKSELKKIQSKRADVAKSLADNADAILAQQDVVQRETLNATTTFFDSLRSTFERIKRRLKAQGKETPASISSSYDQQIASNNDEVRELAKQMAKALKSGNMKLAAEIHDKIDELNTSTEELLAAKFQAAIDAVNDDAAKKLTFNGVQQKLAQLGVTVAQAAQFATTGTGINGAQLGSTNFGALGTALVDQGNIMRQQRGGLADLLAQAQAAGNNEQIEKLTAQINDLDASIVDNAKAIRDNTDAALAAAAEARRTPLDQLLSINNSGTNLLKSLEALGINTSGEQKAILTNNQGVIGGQRTADAQSFAQAVNQYLPGGADFNQAANLSGAALVNYIRGVIQKAQSSGAFNKDELAAIVNYGNNILADATALNENTKALKDLTGSLTQTFTSTAWARFRQAVFDGNGGLMPQYQPYIPSFGGGGVKNGTGLALLHDREVIFTPEQVQALNGVGSSEETHLHITSPIEKFDPVWASRQLSFARRNRG